MRQTASGEGRFVKVCLLYPQQLCRFGFFSPYFIPHFPTTTSLNDIYLWLSMNAIWNELQKNLTPTEHVL